MDDETKLILRAVVGQLVEDLSADAVIISVTRRCSKRTETFAVPYGNAHACRGIAEFTYFKFCEDIAEEEEDDSDD